MAALMTTKKTAKKSATKTAAKARGKTQDRSPTKTKDRDVSTALRELVAALAETEEVESHGSPDFRVRGKTFATYAINHHGDGRVALWLRMPPGAQELYTEHEPTHYFRPPYVGGKGWLGMNLDQGLHWSTIAERITTAYTEVAPAALGKTANVPKTAPPTKPVDPLDFDPLAIKVHAAKVDKLRQRCLALPETSEALRFGDPVWRAGKKTFATAYGFKRRVYFSFWVGVEQQPLYTIDEDVHIPAYTGGNGWITIDVTARVRWGLIDDWLEQSYRHFALKRMLKALDGG